MTPCRSIVHLDADAFFASVEQASDRRLRGKPIAVGGEKRGIIASASYEARQFGIYTPMPTALARRLCPKLVLLPGDFEKYELFSRLMFSYAYDFTPDVEVGSIDEGYIDLTATRKPAVSIAQTIRGAICQALRLSVSEGIAGNKLVSQIASKLKKPSAFEFVPNGGEAQFLSPLASQWLPGVGPKTSIQLTAAGLAHIGQIAQTPIDLLNLLVGSQAPQLRRFARGIDERPVISMRPAAKSYGEQETFAADTTDEEFLDATLRRMADKLMAKVREDGKSIRTVTVKVRYNDMDEEQASESLIEPTALETEIYGMISGLLRRAWRRRVSLRLVSLKLANVYDGRFGEELVLDGSARQHMARQRLAGTLDELRQKYGRGVVLRGHDFILKVAQASSPAGLGGVSPHKNQAKRLETRRRDTCAGVNRPETTPRTSFSPGPELRFRVELKSAANAMPHLGYSIRHHAPRATQRSCIPLNIHSYYSFLDSTLSIRAIVELAKRHELPAIALTDKNNLHGAVEFAQAAAEAGIKPIIGAELNWRGHRVCLYVQNQTGYRNLCRILSRAGSAPASDFAPHTDGLLAVSANPALASLFPGRFYLEINSLEAFESVSLLALPCVASLPIHYELPADRWKYDIVQSIRTLTLLRQQHPEKRLDGDYHFRPDAEMQKRFGAHPELLAHSFEIAERCSFEFSLGKPQFPSYSPDGSAPAAFLRRLALDGLERRYPDNHAALRPQLEEELAIIMDVGYEEYFLVMWDILQECHRRGIEWITRGSAADSLACYCLEISGVCPIRFDLYFRRFLNKERMALNKLPDIDVDFPHDRKDDVIDLIFEKYGPGHTAVVGGFSTFQSRSAFAEVAKVLGVSEHQVRRLTERLPHFSRAGELVETVASTLECRDLPLDQEPYSTALRMAQFLDGFPRYPKMHPCGLVLSRQAIDEITPCFISAKGYPATHFDMDSVEAVGLVKMDILAQGGLAVMRDVMGNCRERTHGTQRSESGTERPLPSHVPQISCDPQTSRTPIEQTSASPSDSLRSLRSFGAPIPISALPSTSGPFDDPKVWSLIASGNARAVHHIESPAMISLCRICNVRDIDTLIAIVSVIRPGAANESKKMEFARRYQGLSAAHYPHPSLEPCLRSTYGLVVYEEHILQICEAFAGLPPGRADILRRALAKDKTELIAQIQIEFANCARRLGRAEAEIAEVWDLVAGFRGYAFCKAHSTAYGVEAYQSAWLKRYYPAEFMAAVLTNGKGFYDALVYILECHRLRIPLLPPSINEPGPQFTVTHPPRPRFCDGFEDEDENQNQNDGRGRGKTRSTKKIRVPVLQVKGLTTCTKEAILRERALGKFSSLADFLARVQPLPEEMEALIRVGAFDEFGQSRTAQYWQFRTNVARNLATATPARAHSQNTPRNAIARLPRHHQPWLLPPGDIDRLPSVPLAEPGRLECLRAEEELLGYPVSGHPLELFPDIAWETYCPVNRLGNHLGEQIVTCGLVIEQRLFHQVTGEPMKFLTLADWTGVVETELFARTYRSYGLSTIRYRVLEITATVEPFENGRGYTLRVLRAGQPRIKKK
ncbi:MAG TPA: DNA polymerase IV [Verrucomicrobiae bacterium]|nr:DNA polymerase IV [Verrucomicrobiae bacterium]